jgi:uncharacterized protein YjlB
MNTETLFFEDDGLIPNSRYPVILYTQAMKDAAASDYQKLFAENTWPGAWINGIFSYHHYHSTAHEVLGISSGWVEVLLGGEQGKTVRLSAGDIVILPAGVGHKNLAQSPDLSVVGSYPQGQSPDMNYGKPGEYARSVENIARVPLPGSDPIGESGSLTKLWRL